MARAASLPRRTPTPRAAPVSDSQPDWEIRRPVPCVYTAQYPPFDQGGLIPGIVDGAVFNTFRPQPSTPTPQTLKHCPSTSPASSPPVEARSILLTDHGSPIPAAPVAPPLSLSLSHATMRCPPSLDRRLLPLGKGWRTHHVRDIRAKIPLRGFACRWTPYLVVPCPCPTPSLALYGCTVPRTTRLGIPRDTKLQALEASLGGLSSLSLPGQHFSSLRSSAASVAQRRSNRTPCLPLR